MGACSISDAAGTAGIWGAVTTPIVRPLIAVDREEWFRLWQGYLDFYGTDLDDAISNTTWSRLLGTDKPVWGLVAVGETGIAGFLNYVLHDNTWTDKPVCYLEDLYVDPAARGRGAGRALVEHLVALARRERWHRVYWMTKAGNKTARELYDRITPATDWVRYDIDIREPEQEP
jgi:GNAT superfamily N-acetyltransferase